MKRKTDLSLGLFLVAFSIAGIFLLPVGIDTPTSVSHRSLAPDFWPLVVLASLGTIGVVLFIASWFGNEAQVAASRGIGLAHLLFRLAILAVVLLGNYYLMSILGIVITSILSILLLSYFGGERRWTMLVPLAIAPPLLLYGFFVYLANIPLPLGIFY